MCVAQWRDRVCVAGGGWSLAELASGVWVINEEQAMKTIEEKIEIYRAYLNGKQIQWKSKSSNSVAKDWEDITTPSFNYEACDYQVKPEPTKHKVAYALIHKLDGYVFWTVSPERHIDRSFYQRCPEFDIIANNKDQK